MASAMAAAVLVALLAVAFGAGESNQSSEGSVFSQEVRVGSRAWFRDIPGTTLRAMWSAGHPGTANLPARSPSAAGPWGGAMVSAVIDFVVTMSSD